MVRCSSISRDIEYLLENRLWGHEIYFKLKKLTVVALQKYWKWYNIEEGKHIEERTLSRLSSQTLIYQLLESWGYATYGLITHLFSILFCRSYLLSYIYKKLMHAPRQFLRVRLNNVGPTHLENLDLK